jgi:hypothetical protein
MLINLLPTAGDITTLRIVRDLQTELSFSEEEHAVLKLKQDGDRIQWDNSAETLKDVAVGPRGHLLIAERLQEISDKKELTLTQVALFEKFEASA